VKSRPQKPNIKLSDQRAYLDYIEILREQERLLSGSLSSLISAGKERNDSILSRPDSINSCPDSVASDTSYLNISEEDVQQTLADALEVESQLLQSMQNRELEETLTRKEVAELNSDPTANNNITNQMNPINKSITSKIDITNGSNLKKLCFDRPNSPTSKFLSPLLENESELSNKIYRQLSPLLHKLSDLEGKVKTMSSLQVKVAVLQEEKRQLSSMLKNKRNSSV
jgi:hypothetical protein